MSHRNPPPEIEIAPVPFRPDPLPEKPGRSGSLKRVIAGVIGLVFICLAGAAGFVFTAKVRGGQWNDLLDVPVVPMMAPNQSVLRWVLQWDQGKNPNDLCVTKCTPRTQC